MFSLPRYFGKNSKPGTDYLVDNFNKSLHREPVHGSILVQQAYGNSNYGEFIDRSIALFGRSPNLSKKVKGKQSKVKKSKNFTYTG